MFEGWNIGSVTIKRVRLTANGSVAARAVRHGGDPRGGFAELIRGDLAAPVSGICVTGPLASSTFALPYLPEPICIEAALGELGVRPDLVLSLGGESFVIYFVQEGTIRGMVSTTRCAAGSGEFLVQQLGRLGFDLERGIGEAERGQIIKLASRCSVHCKSDSTHKLNKGECTAADVARSVIRDLAQKVFSLTASSGWPRREAVVIGGLSRNRILLADLHQLMAGTNLRVLEHSPYLEAFGAAVTARQKGVSTVLPIQQWLKPRSSTEVEVRAPLANAAHKVARLPAPPPVPATPGMRAILGVDAGSTTTKAVLIEEETGAIIGSVYLRTHGNPVRAAQQCLARLAEVPGVEEVRVIAAAATGSGRELVSVSLDNSPSFNEILAHARAARETTPEVDTLFEIGGQDAKFVLLQEGIPVDYSMNDGCSAGTGSFLEEAAASDMQVPTEEIGPRALASERPVAFGEQCAAFINSEIRTALQRGIPHRDILAGLVYAIVDNYLTRVVGTRHVGEVVLLQGGVALNPAVANAVAAITGRRIMVPPHPELMGALGAALMARDGLRAGQLAALPDRALNSLGQVTLEMRESTRCGSCDNNCEVRRFRIGERTYPFGGLCSKWEQQRRPKHLREPEGEDLVALRQEIMFKRFAPPPPQRPRARVGLPLALTTYELYPYYAALLTGLGCEVVLSRPGRGERRTNASLCYPAEILHGAVDDLLAQGVDWVFLPGLREMPIPAGHAHSYLCPTTQDSPGVIKAFFASAADRILSPEMAFSAHLEETSRREIIKMARRLAVNSDRAGRAHEAAVEHQRRFQETYRTEVSHRLAGLKGPLITLVGRPYVAYAQEVNLSIPRKIISRGFHVVPADALPPLAPPNERNVWYFTQQAASAVEHSRQRSQLYLCYLSCFSCGPDSIIHHRLRRELAGKPFCFLEIDSHTAHAGIETRVGAFLDIVKERESRPAPARVTPVASHRRPSRVEMSQGKLRIVDDDGRSTGLDDPRVLHVQLADLPRIASEMIASLYGTQGWRVVCTPFTNHEILQLARRVCSGRECLPFLSMAGKIVRHLEQRPADEVTVFHLLEQEGPCQVGNWFDAVSIIFERLGAGRAVTVWPTIKNNYLGGGDRVAALLTAAVVTGDILGEVRSSLRCLARDPADALALLDELERNLLQVARRGLVATDRELARMGQVLADVPRRGRPEQTPKVLLFGGVNRIFVNGPVRDFFEERGILTKTTDVSEFLSLLECEPVCRRSFARGQVTPDRQMGWPDLLLGGLRDRDVRASAQVLRGRVHCTVIESMEKRARRLLAPSGLLFTPHIPFHEVLDRGHEHVSLNGFTEVPFTVGRYVAALQSGAFDGFVNVGAFNCAPANLATAVIRSLSGRSDVPYAVVEADGSSITASQLRQLETVAAQCQRRRAQHGGPARPAPAPDAQTDEPSHLGPQPRRAAAGLGTERESPQR